MDGCGEKSSKSMIDAYSRDCVAVNVTVVVAVNVVVVAPWLPFVLDAAVSITTVHFILLFVFHVVHGTFVRCHYVLMTCK